MDSDDYFTFVRREDHSKITSASYLTVDQGNACAALTTTEAEVKIMPDSSSHWHRAPTDLLLSVLAIVVITGCCEPHCAPGQWAPHFRRSNR